MSRPNLRRILAVSASAALVALTVLAAPASAGNTRDVYFGSPATPPDNGSNGVVTFTPTRAGGNTITNIVVQNNGSQTLNHVMLLGGAAADAAPDNALYPAPTQPSLDGLAYAAVFPTGACTWSPSTLSCDLGQIQAGAPPVVISVVIQTPGALATAAHPWFGLYVSETNSTGSNQDNFYASGDVTTLSPTCSGTNSDANYFLAGSNVNLNTLDCTTALTGPKASLHSGNAVSGLGGYGELSIGGSISGDCSVLGYVCYGNAVTATVLGGNPVPGGLEWDVTWYGTKSIKGVIHFLDGGGYEVITFKKSDQCSATPVAPCWKQISSSNGSADPLWFRAIFVTTGNGKVGGWV